MLRGRGIEPSGARLLSYPPRRSAKNVNSLRVLVGFGTSAPPKTPRNGLDGRSRICASDTAAVTASRPKTTSETRRKEVTVVSGHQDLVAGLQRDVLFEPASAQDFLVVELERHRPADNQDLLPFCEYRPTTSHGDRLHHG